MTKRFCIDRKGIDQIIDEVNDFNEWMSQGAAARLGENMSSLVTNKVVFLANEAIENCVYTVDIPSTTINKEENND